MLAGEKKYVVQLLLPMVDDVLEVVVMEFLQVVAENRLQEMDVQLLSVMVILRPIHEHQSFVI